MVTDNLLNLKLFSLLITAGVIFFLSPEEIVLAYIVFGQGHFFITYKYQYLAKKINSTYVVLYLLVIIPLMYYSYFHGSIFFYNTLYVSAAVIFLFHHMKDEVRLVNERANLVTSLSALPVILLYSTLVIDQTYNVNTFLIVSLVSVLSLGLHFILKCIYINETTKTQIFFYIATATLFSVHLFSIPIGIATLFGGLIIYHYINWYLYYFVKIPEQEKGMYIQSIIMVNLVVVSFFILYNLQIHEIFVVLGMILFSKSFFYIWTIMHVLFTFRITDKSSFLLK